MIPWVDKIQISVRLGLDGIPAASGSFWLLPQAENHGGPQTLLDLLNEPGRVVPFQRAGDGATVLISRAQLEWVAADVGEDAALVQPGTYMATRTERVRIRLRGGEEFDGMLVIEMPTQFNRASDFLNSDGDFFPVLTAEGYRLVNKSRVLDIVLAEAASRQAAGSQIA